MNIAIVDDEQFCLENIQDMCLQFQSKHCFQLTLSSFSDGVSFLESFQTERYSIVFMDIYMNGLNGLETAAKVRKVDDKCILIFLTSSKEFMPEAFSFHAFEYIVKPFSYKRFEKVLLDAINLCPDISKYVEILSGRRKVPIFLGDILSVTSDAHYLDIYLNKRKGTKISVQKNQGLESACSPSRHLQKNIMAHHSFFQ